MADSLRCVVDEIAEISALRKVSHRAWVNCPCPNQAASVTARERQELVEWRSRFGAVGTLPSGIVTARGHPFTSVWRITSRER